MPLEPNHYLKFLEDEAEAKNITSDYIIEQILNEVQI